MIVLGIDAQRLRIGWALVSVVGELAPDEPPILPVDCGCAVLDGDPGSFVSWWCKGMRAVDLVYVESPHVGYSRRGAVEHAMFIGRVLQQAERRWPDAPVQLIAPQEWKSIIGLPGNAKKEQILRWAIERGANPATQDAADALGIAYAGAIRNAQIVQAAGA